MAISIEKFQEQGGRLKTDDIDFEAFRREPLHPDVLRCLSYMHDIEYQTVLYTRELLLMPAWNDPQFTAFLTLWNYEEYGTARPSVACSPHTIGQRTTRG